MTFGLAAFVYVIVGMLWSCVAVGVGYETSSAVFAAVFWPLDMLRGLWRCAKAWWCE